MPFHTEAFTQIRFDIYTRIHTEAFRHRLFFRESQKLWHREAFTPRILYHRSFYTHTSFSTEAFTQRSFWWAQELLHRRLYTQKLVHTEAFTHRSFYTEKPLHTDAFPQKKRFHRAAFIHFKKSQFYVSFWRSGHHIVRKGYIRRWKIAIFDLIKSQFYTSFISRKRLCLTFQNG